MQGLEGRPGIVLKVVVVRAGSGGLRMEAAVSPGEAKEILKRSSVGR